MKNLAIIDKDTDILRIIPLYGDKYPGFKFGFRDNHFIVKSWELGQKSPQVIEHIRSNAEITYHSSKKYKNSIPHKKDKDPIVHIKHTDNKPDVELYTDISSKIRDIKLDTCFPLPLCKVEIKEGNKNTYKKKPHNVVFDLRDDRHTKEYLQSPSSKESDFPKFNIVEIYVTSKEFNGENFTNMWPNYDILWLSTTIDYLIKGPEVSELYLNKLNSGIPQIGYCVITSFDQFNILIRPYYDENINENSITFYENHGYIALLATARVQLIDMNTDEKLSGIAPAFVFDLDWQLKHGVSMKEGDQRYRKFKKMLDIVKELDLDNCKYVFCMPQISKQENLN